jgi:Carboxypeptidase regulatory-like domain
VLRGTVRGPGGAPVPGARVSVRGTALAAVADATGAFEIRDVPDGDAVLQAAADGYVAATAAVRARAGATVGADVTLARAPTAAEPDRELSGGAWGVVSRADALATLGGTLGAIDGLSIESIAKSTAGTRQRIRVTQLTADGQRIELLETRAGAAVRGGEGPARVTALRVLPPSEAYPFSTGTASFGNILITAKTTASQEVLRTLLGRLADVAP